MKKCALFIALLFAGSANAALLFDNGTTIDSSNTTWNDSYSSFTIYDDFQFLEDSTITDINYSIFTDSSSSYTQSYVTILDAIGGTVVVPEFSVVGSLSSNGLVSNNSNVPNGYDVLLSGLSIDLFAGSYAIGLSTEGTHAASIGSGDSGFGSALFQNTISRAEHMAFSIEGSSVSVPEPASIALLSLGLVGLGFSMKKKPA